MKRTRGRGNLWWQVLLLSLGLAALAMALPYGTAREFLAGVFFVESVTPEGLKDKFVKAKGGKGKVALLIVPGHDDEVPGAEFSGVQEAELTAELGEMLNIFFSRDREFETILVRSRRGYHPIFSSFLSTARPRIVELVSKHRPLTDAVRRYGLAGEGGGVPHNRAPAEVALQLYGINLWANEHKADIVIHLHFNDYGSRRRNVAGEYAGFSVYTPGNLYSNARASRAVGEAIVRRLAVFYPISNLPQEGAGLVPDEDLIAIGANNTLDAAGVLVEYDYLYNTVSLGPSVRKSVLQDLAFQTYLGIQDFFGNTKVTGRFPTTLLPHRFEEDLRNGMRDSEAVLALQAALASEGVYPPPGFTRHRCPLSGNFGPCTVRAVKAFQNKHGISFGDGMVTWKTKEMLNELYAP